MTGKCPFMGRRDLLRSFGKAGGAVAVAGLVGRAAISEAATQAAPVATRDDDLLTAIPFRGIHQAGVVTPRPQFATVVAFDVLSANRGDLQRLFQMLTERIAFPDQGRARRDG